MKILDKFFDLSFSLDGYLMSKVTKFSHYLQRTLGITNYFVAKIGIALASLALSMGILDYFIPFLHSHTTKFSFFIKGLCIIDMIWRSFLCSKAEEAMYESDVKPAFLLRLSGNTFWRLCWIGFLAIDLAYFPGSWKKNHLPDIVDENFFSLGLAIFYYFIAVNPLPPGKSKVREWINGLFRVLRPASQRV